MRTSIQPVDNRINSTSLAKRFIAPVTFEAARKPQAVAQIVSAVENHSAHVFAFCNMHTFNVARRSAALAEALSTATVYNDGLGIDAASRLIFGSPFPDNLNGTDLTPAVLSALTRKTSVFLVGSPPGIADEAATRLSMRFPEVSIVGTQHGFFEPHESDKIVARIRAAGTELLLVGMGNPQQEIWASQICEKSGAAVMCVGAFLDFAAGRIGRAPKPVRALRLEWLYRLCREPLRLSGRYIGGAAPFLLAVLAEKYRHHHKIAEQQHANRR